MRVELLYFDGCPNWTVAEERLHEALRSVDREGVHVAKVRVGSPQEAEELGFIGSPTIRFDGVDPFASGCELVGLACRVYATPDGLGGSPTTAQLVHVLA
ncbi:thioredoxin family protein [Nocardioides sp.]|uniref:thioredoxin family protein n=1 Tax=Nocardioides sp. TaxID=35761 RepID=UPI002732324B|nr:thioredoxin family protein [Nocardioides sp.]MDP3891530.1 thioredoxin family protein [Nocardioides sp.]